MASINETPIVSNEWQGIIPTAWNAVRNWATRPITFTPEESARLLADAREYGYTGPVPTPPTPTQTTAPTINTANNAQRSAPTVAQSVPVITVNAERGPVTYSANDPRFMDNYANRTQIGTVSKIPLTTNAIVEPVTYTAPVAPVQSITSAEYIGQREAMPRLQSTTVAQLPTPTYGVNALDIPNASMASARQYGEVLAQGRVPVISDWDAMGMNRLRAQGALALSAATKAADANAAYHAMNDPNMRNLAQQISSTQGVSFDTALKMAMQGALTQQGNYALANRYESSTVLPAMEAENQRRIAMALETGTDAPAMTDIYGNTFNSRGVNSVYETGDGETVRVNTPAITYTGTPNAVRGLNRGVAYSTAPVSDTYNMQVGNIQGQIAAARGQQTAAAERAEAAGKAATQQQRNMTDLARVQAAIMKAEAEARRGTTYPRSDTPAQQARVLLQLANGLPEDDPRRAQYMERVAELVGGSISE